MRVKCLAQEHNTMSPARPRTRTTRSGVECTNHEATAPPPLSEYSRHITTFVIQCDLYSHKRLSFGMTSAPEKYQQIVRDVLRGSEGVGNIAADLIVHGNGVEEHDKRLKRSNKPLLMMKN